MFPIIPSSSGVALRTVTWNSADNNAHAVLSGGDLVVTSDANIWGSARATHGIGSSDKRYWEVEFTTVNSGNLIVGISNSTFSHADGVITGFGATSAGFGDGTNGVLGGTLAKSYTGTSTHTTGSVFMLCRDGDKLWLGKNGTWYNSGDPAAGTGEWLTGLSTTEFFPSCSIYSTLANVLTLRCLPGSLSYAVPTGFKAMGLAA